jgi:hypothetical protein
MVLWQLQARSAANPHGMKYRLYYGLADGSCISVGAEYLSGNEEFTGSEVKEYPRLPDGGQAESRISQWQQLFSSRRSEASRRIFATEG